MKLQRDCFRDYTAERTLFIRRVLIAFCVILLLFGILVAKLYYLQILCFTDYYTKSNKNRIKSLPIIPTRGIIYDRNNIPLAFNRTVYQLELIPEKVSDLAKTIQQLKSVINITNKDITTFQKELKRSRPFKSIMLKNGLNNIEVARFYVNQYRFLGVEIKSYQRRYYPYQSDLTHVLGYVSKVNDIEDAQRLHKDSKKLPNYASYDDIGKLGIERYYEEILHGQFGYEKVEINNRGRIMRQLHEEAPQAGCDLYLTIDLNLQTYIKKLLIGSRAAVMVSDPRNGEILAMVSMPSYDPNLFVNGISSQEYNYLLHNKNKPLINRTTQGTYPPASTVKPYIAVSALTLGVINRNTSLFDPGWWQLPGSEKRFRDWKRWGHGRLTVTKSLEESADTFFYQVAYDMGIDRLGEWMSKFGYGHPSGIDLTEDNKGNMPTREWKMKRFKKPWYQGDTIPVGIGQGYWTATPVQMNKALMILINNGEIKTPHLMMYRMLGRNKVPWFQEPEPPIANVNSLYWEIVKDGMYGVANRPNGTARKSFNNARYKIAAKSGTAQVFGLKTNESYHSDKLTEHLRDHKLMTAFAPYDKPRVAVTIILENGGAGLSVGTLMRQILDHIILGNKNKS